MPKALYLFLRRVRAIRDFPRPSTVKGPQDFLGMIHFYHRFVPNVAEILVPMHAALAGRKRLASLVWTPEMEKALTASKNAFADATLLIHPVEDAPTSLTVDASIVAIGGVLEQRNNGVWSPLGFFSRKLQTPRETKYSTFDRELLAARFTYLCLLRYLHDRRLLPLWSDPVFQPVHRFCVLLVRLLCSRIQFLHCSTACLAYS